MKRVIIILIALVFVLSFAACNGAEEQALKPSTSEAKDTGADNTTQTTKADENTQVAEQTQQPTMEPTTEPIPEGIEHANILLMGSMDRDFTEEGSATYAMTHILITLEPENKVIKFTTLPYNLGIEVKSDNGTEVQQLQFLCGSYGEDAATQIIAENFGINIDYWVLMNMNGVISIVDTLEGIEIDIKELTINEAADHVVDFLGLVWEEVTQTGLQMLSGVQTAGYFVDTMDIDQDNWLQEEEMMFRDRHPNIIRGVITAVKLAGLTSEDMITIAQNISDNYASNIPQDQWQTIADTAIYCLENEAQFLHVPQVIDTAEHDGMPPMIYDADTDVPAVLQFVSE